MSTWTDDQIVYILNKMKKDFGTKLPDPVHYPQQFKHYLKMFLYFDSKKQQPVEREELK